MGTDHTIKDNNVNPYKIENNLTQDDNFQLLLHNWNRWKNNLTIFLGAGASYGALNGMGKYMPGGYELRNELWTEFMLLDEQKKSFDFNNLGLLTLESAAALAEIKSTRSDLEDFLEERFKIEKPLWQHAVLPYLKPKALFTTNYDDLIELGWRISNNENQLQPVFNDETSELGNKYVPLYKPHGSVVYPHKKPGKGGLVITQFDYFEVVEDRKAMVSQFIPNVKNNCVIFIGYGFNDFDIAAELYKIKKEQSGTKWFAVFPRNDSDVRRMLHDKYGIKQINGTFYEFITALDKAKEFIPDEWKFEKILKELSSKLQGFD